MLDASVLVDICTGDVDLASQMLHINTKKYEKMHLSSPPKSPEATGPECKYL